MCDICHTYWLGKSAINFRAFNPRTIARFSPWHAKKIEQPALIYLSQLLASGNDPKRLGDWQAKSHVKISFGDLYEVTRKISDAQPLMSRSLTKLARRNLTILK
ncbi:hypothetical protein QUB25_10110 [Microcoleus sp. B3-D7]